MRRNHLSPVPILKQLSPCFLFSVTLYISLTVNIVFAFIHPPYLPKTNAHVLADM